LIFLIGLLVCFLMNSKIAAYQHDKADVVMFGDSLTENGKWNKLFPDINIVNLGFGGDTTHKMLRRMGEVYKYNPKYCVVMGGFNDIDQGRDLNEIYKDYTSILKKLKNRKIIPVILSTTYVVEHFRTSALINTKIDKLNGELKEYAYNNKIIFIDLSQSLSKNHYLSPDFAVDHVHLNDKAYEIWKDKIKNIIYKNQV